MEVLIFKLDSLEQEINLISEKIPYAQGVAKEKLKSDSAACVSERNSLFSFQKSYSYLENKISELVTNLAKNNDDVDVFLYYIGKNVKVYRLAGDAASILRMVTQMEDQLDQLQLEDLSNVIIDIGNNWEEIDGIIKDLTDSTFGTNP